MGGFNWDKNEQSNYDLESVLPKPDTFGYGRGPSSGGPGSRTHAEVKAADVEYIEGFGPVIPEAEIAGISITQRVYNPKTQDVDTVTCSLMDLLEGLSPRRKPGAVLVPRQDGGYTVYAI